MMKRRLLLITTILLSTLTVLADGETDDKDALVDGKFKVSGVTGLNLSQTALSNWSAGGDNSFSGSAYLNTTAKRKSGNWLWENDLILEYGLGYSSKGIPPTKKTGDKLEFASKIGYSTDSKWYYTAMGDFKTQFAKGYNYTSEGDGKGEYISKFMAPAYSNVSLGLEFKPKDWYSIYFSPAAGKFTFVGDSFLANKNAFGIGVDKKFKAEFGAYLKGGLEKEIFTNVKVKSTVSFFTAYNDTFGNVDVDWDMLISMKVNKFLSATLNTSLKYDDDIKSVNDDGVVGGPKIQFKEVLGVGFAYNF